MNDRQLSLSLVLELALQRGRLLHVLKALMLLLRLSDNGNIYFASPSSTVASITTDDDKDDDNVTYDNEGMISRAPLVPILRRVGDIPVREIKRYSGRKKNPVSLTFQQTSCQQLFLFVYGSVILLYLGI